jgi:cyclophilin family peptidyl-prolyl cis-trans isomerase
VRRRGSGTGRRAEAAASSRRNRQALIALGGVAAVVVLAWLLGSIVSGLTPASSARTSAPGAGQGAPTTRTNLGAKPAGCPTTAPAALPSGDTRSVSIATRKGAIIIAVRASLAPLAAGNFVALAGCGYYDGVIFHRLVPGFVIQGGDRAGTGSGREPGYTIKDEPVTTAYKRGTVAMARTSAPNSQGSQFFIVLSDSNSLAQTNTYSIFGTVTSGMEVVDAIAAMPNSGSPSNTALDPVAMDTVTVATP